MTRSMSPRFWLARIRLVVVAVMAAVMVASVACSSTVPSTSGVSSASSAEAGTPLAGAAATQLDTAVAQAMTEASIPGAIVGIWARRKTMCGRLVLLTRRPVRLCQPTCIAESAA